ncbi:hypothetical protein [Shimia biformata]|uniref:hypothetical protein n=1 Tax=Shimia biformata TaxID=1294299 RepID=UPI00194FC9F9|nr:hypothetical protein [Shimia biformata]
MARNTNGTGFSLKDELFNDQSLGVLAAEYAAGVPGFDADAFLATVLPGLEPRGLLERLDWIADCIEAQLSPDFNVMADQLDAAMPPILNPEKRDDDFGRFIHAVPGILAVRHGLEHHRDRALDLIHAATKRFSMEFYIRPFLNRWPEQTLARLDQWAGDENYHVRRLVSEGTRPKLPWARNIDLDPLVPLRFLDRLHADPTRYVTRSVANHMNDIAKIAPDVVTSRLTDWQGAARQEQKELDWITRHSLRTLVKQGDSAALSLLGYRTDAPVSVEGLRIDGQPRIGDALSFSMTLTSTEKAPVLVDYRLRFHRPSGRPSEKVFKLKQGQVGPGAPLTLTKRHPLKGNASTFTLYPGPHVLTVQVNGRDVAEQTFDLID